MDLAPAGAAGARQGLTGEPPDWAGRHLRGAGAGWRTPRAGAEVEGAGPGSAPPHSAPLRVPFCPLCSTWHRWGAGCGALPGLPNWAQMGCLKRFRWSVGLAPAANQSLNSGEGKGQALQASSSCFLLGTRTASPPDNLFAPRPSRSTGRAAGMAQLGPRAAGLLTRVTWPSESRRLRASLRTGSLKPPRFDRPGRVVRRGGQCVSRTPARTWALPSRARQACGEKGSRQREGGW